VKKEDSTARTFRRHWNLLSKVAEKVLSIGYQQQTIQNTITDMRGEANERLLTIERDLEQIRKYVGIIAKHSQVPHVPVLEERPSDH